MKLTNHTTLWSAADIAQLGTATDAVIARRLGRSIRAVEGQRRLKGIAPYHLWRREWTRAEVRLLGALPDAAVAERLGISRRCVLTERRRRGIGPARPENTPMKYR